ncbi:MAG: hypothetical protein K8L99_15930 [Anaerolineae bacterium]|nr:hypothetical protein [Anaerolineae bacterium]
MAVTSKRKLYLHIGYHKTGTTAIQTALVQENQLFLDHGYHYPQTGLQGRGHANLAWEVRHFRRFSRVNGTLADVIKNIERVAAPRVIISSEEFCKCNRAEIESLAQTLQDYDVMVIIYLRRQDQLLQSLWAQVTKTGHQIDSFPDWINSLNDGQTSIPDLAEERVIPPLNYAAAVADWASAFGQENIRVRPYERSQLNPNILIDFMQICDLEDTSWVPAVGESNVTPGIKTLETIRYLATKMKDSLSSDMGDHNRFYAVFINTLRETANGIGWNDQKLSLITPEIYQQVMTLFAEGNREVARTYLDREELFLEPFQEKPITAFDINDLTAEEAIEVIGPAFAEILHKASGSAHLYGRLYSRFGGQLLGHRRLLHFIERHPQLARTLRAFYRRFA